MSADMADYRFRVSDAYAVPLRGWLLRLKLLDGDFQPRMLGPGTSIRLVDPHGNERVVSVLGLAATAGRQTRERVEKYREFDIVLSERDAVRDGQEVGLGWEVRPDH
jgi:hypothetical protein